MSLKSGKKENMTKIIKNMDITSFLQRYKYIKKIYVLETLK